MATVVSQQNPGSATNVLANPGAEVAGGWSPNNGAVNTQTFDSSYFRSGSRSSKGAAVTSGSGTILSAYDVGGAGAIAVTPGTSYTFTVYASTAETAATGRLGFIQYFSGASVRTTYNLPAASAAPIDSTLGVWTPLTYTITIPAGVNQVRTIVTVGKTTTTAGMTAWIDDASFTLTPGTVWDVLTPVGSTRLTTWKALAAVTSTRASTWVTRASIVATRATTWAATTTAASSRASTWVTRAIVGTQRINLITNPQPTSLTGYTNDVRFPSTLVTAPWDSSRSAISLQLQEYYTNPGFTDSVSPWISSSGATATWQAAGRTDSTGQAKISYATAAAGASLYQTISSLSIGGSYTVRAWLYVPAASLSVGAYIRVTGVASSTQVSTADVWTLVTVTFTATATSHTVSIQAANAVTAGQFIYADDASFASATLIPQVYCPQTTAIPAGAVVRWRAKVLSSSTSQAFTLRLRDGVSTVISNGSSFTTPSGWTEVTNTFTTVVAAATPNIYIVMTATTRDVSLIFGDLLLEFNTSGAYFDGGTPNGTTVLEWTGTPNASTSLQRDKLATRDTIWNVPVVIISTRSSSWAALSSIVVTRATTWAAQASTIASRATTWQVSAQAVSVRSSTWAVRVSVVVSLGSTWRTSQAVSAARVTLWLTRATLSTTRTATWTVTVVSVGTRSTQWAIVGRTTFRPAQSSLARIGSGVTYREPASTAYRS